MVLVHERPQTLRWETGPTVIEANCARLRNAGSIVMVLGAGRLRSEISNLLSVQLFLCSPAFVLGELLIVSPAMSTLIGLRWRD